MGTTGESPTVSHEEHKRCIEIAVDVCKNTGVKVLAGAGSNCVEEATDLAVFAQKAGADTLLIVAPYYNKPTQEGIYLHYATIAKTVELPIMLYNVPGRCGVDILPATIKRLTSEFSHIYAVKEASGNMERCVEYGATMPNLAVFCGDDALNFPMLANGGKGLVSVTANLVPSLIKKLTTAVFENDFATSKAINDRLFTLNKALFLESNPIPIKYAMHLVGLMPNLEYRLPLCTPSNATIEALKVAIKTVEGDI
jgi:4-hydroxy-tetrahydrodipicolinate synthase